MKKLPVALLVAASAALGPGYTPSTAASPNDYRPGELVCHLNWGYNISYINQNYGTTVDGWLQQTGSYLLRIDNVANVESLAVAIAQDPAVQFCEPNYLADAPEGVQSSQPFIDLQAIGSYTEQTAANSLALTAAHTLSTGEGARVAIIDGGINTSHELFSSLDISGFDYIDNDASPSDEPGGRASGHGTFIAGIIHLVAPEADFKVYRVLDTVGRGDGFSIAEAVLEAVESGCRIINLSLVMNYPHGALELAIEYAFNHDVLVVAAAGNDASSQNRFPATNSMVISVAALDSANIKADFSNYGPHIDLSAPGTQIYAPFLGNQYAWWDGTSFAVPFVVGQAALLRSRNAGASINTVIAALQQTTLDVSGNNPGFENQLGVGLIQPLAALSSFVPLVCGDIDQSGTAPDISDITVLIDHLFISLAPLQNVVAANVAETSTSGIDIADLTQLITTVFMGGQPLTCGG